jgi:hypothetical protein
VDTPAENLLAMFDAARRFGPLAVCRGIKT